ncbi:APC family permease [Micromonospora sp. WMMD1082]|uniref:APC family permease n=1 Tax=Micromonospora sp. WMMD1082 TaxID=3016104 RepID=UPI0024168863|nr:APC family permease [Micromonospora sp. WMMD1082]MDG4795174.1 APC family permease [Micromonospora sp. WMMD1082]
MSAGLQVALTRRTVTPAGLWVFGAAASAPLVVLVGGIPAIYATTGVVALPLTYVLVAVGVALLAVGYTAMAARVGHPAAYYAILARGVGPGWGVAAGMVALVAYGAIQTSLYGLLGGTLAGAFGGAWWVYAAVALAVVGALGVRTIVLSTRVLGTVLVVSLLIVVVFVVAGASQPAAGAVSWEGFEVSGLAVTGIGGAVAFVVASLMGVDAAGSFGEESIDKTSIGRAMIGAALVLGGAYALAAWATGVAVGPGSVAEQAADPGLPFAVLERAGGWWVGAAAGVLLVFAIITSMVAFHCVFARYVFAMARERTLPVGLARGGSGKRVKAPRNGSLTQTVVAAGVVAGFGVAGLDPIGQMFTWLSSLGAMGLLSLLLAASVAALKAPPEVSGPRPGVWQWRLAPFLGSLAGCVLLGLMILNAGPLLGAAPGSAYPYLLPVILLGVAGLGGMWAGHLRQVRPEVHAGIGHGTPPTNAVPDDVDFNI